MIITLFFFKIKGFTYIFLIKSSIVLTLELDFSSTSYLIASKSSKKLIGHPNLYKRYKLNNSGLFPSLTLLSN